MFGFLTFVILFLVIFLFITRKQAQKGFAWWVEVTTAQPKCTYYFGPFVSAEEAKRSEAGYVEDLEKEGSKGIAVHVKWCQPKELTIAEEEQLTYS